MNLMKKTPLVQHATVKKTEVVCWSRSKTYMFSCQTCFAGSRLSEGQAASRVDGKDRRRGEGAEWSLWIYVYRFTVQHSADSPCSIAGRYIGSGVAASANGCIDFQSVLDPSFSVPTSNRR